MAGWGSQTLDGGPGGVEAGLERWHGEQTQAQRRLACLAGVHQGAAVMAAQALSG